MSEERLKEMLKEREHEEKIKHERYFTRLVAIVAAVIIAFLVFLYNQEHDLRMKLLDDYQMLQEEYEELRNR